jgi:hypothetical protein
MIRFNNYPPSDANDVELTEAGYTAIHEGLPTGRNHGDIMYGYGSAIGHTIVAAMERPTTNGAHELAADIVTYVFATTPDSHSSAFASGFGEAVRQEVKSLRVNAA